MHTSKVLCVALFVGLVGCDSPDYSPRKLADPNGTPSDPNPAPNPDPNPLPEPRPDPEPGIQNPDPNPEPFPEPEPTPEPEPFPEPDPNPGMNPEPSPEPDPNPEPTPDPEPIGPDQGSVFTYFELNLNPRAGRDFDGDGRGDNALGGLLQDLSGLLGDSSINDVLDRAIASGELTMGLWWPGVGSIEREIPQLEPLWLSQLDAEDRGGIEFSAPSSVWRDAAQMRGRVFRANNQSIGDLRGQAWVPWALGPFVLRSKAEAVAWESVLQQDRAGVEFFEVTVTGAVPLTEVLGGINDYLLDGQCACLGLRGPLIDLDAGVGPQACSQDYDDSMCFGDPISETCSTIAGACILAVPVIAGQTDVDLNGDGVPDALSFSANASGQGAFLFER